MNVPETPVTAASASSLPTGTVTLLFTDIEGSTQHWEEQRAAMGEALRKHDELIRSAIEANGGHVFKTVGDAFYAVFARPSDAVAAAAAAQRSITAQDWSAVGKLAVRIALHSGNTEERGGDYFGPPVNRAARLLAVAHGGQVVISGATAQLLRGVMPEQSELRDLGEHRLKDLVEPEHVWQLTAPGLTETFPPLRSLESLPNNLPQQVTPLIGREDVLAEVEPLVLEHRLVSLVGTGGIGKTRVALQVGADLLDGSGDGVWLVEVATLSDPASVVNTIASTFGLREQAERSMLDVLLQYLRPRHLLLILDTCEHLIEEMARVADAISRAAPQVRLLATSREPLRIAAEHVYRLPSLAVPPESSPTAEEALRYGAVALFAERATASDAKFKLTDETAPIVAEICRRLDGIALAIELAAARVKVLAPRELAQKLDERFRVLTGGSRTALPRQQTMRALIDWSYDLLSEQEQRLFRRVAIFAGGWTLEATEAVTTDETLDALDIVDLMSSLVEKSLVIAEAEEGRTRYRLLESTRAFAAEKLEQSGERDTLARWYAHWAADLADRAGGATLTEPTSRVLAEYVPELENARSAIHWALSHDEVVLAARIAVGFYRLYRYLGMWADLRSWLDAVLARLDVDAQPALAAQAWTALSSVVFGSRRTEAAQRGVELSEGCNDAAVTALSLAWLASALSQTAGRYEEAQAAIDRALQLSQEHELTRSLVHVIALNYAGTIAGHRGQLEEARQAHGAALALTTALGNEFTETGIRINMAELEFRFGDTARALELVSAITAEARGTRLLANVQSISNAFLNSAAYKIAPGDIAGARNDAREALRLARGADLYSAAIAIQHLATVAARSGDPRRGARLRGYADAWYRSEGNEREPTEARTYEILTASLREKLSDAEIEALAAEGARMTEDQAVAEALAV
jgi:predicted ATPase/class 3 adenylate cyclase